MLDETPLMQRSILNDVKKLNDIDADYKVFDLNIILYINAAFATLFQVESRSLVPFQIESDKETWDAIANPASVALLKTYIVMKVKLSFDPPPTSYAIQAIEKQIAEMEWRLNVASDRRIHVHGE